MTLLSENQQEYLEELYQAQFDQAVGSSRTRELHQKAILFADVAFVARVSADEINTTLVDANKMAAVVKALNSGSMQSSE